MKPILRQDRFLGCLKKVDFCTGHQSQRSFIKTFKIKVCLVLCIKKILNIFILEVVFLAELKAIEDQSLICIANPLLFV